MSRFGRGPIRILISACGASLLVAIECTTLAAEVKTIPQLKVEVDELKQTILKLHSVHLAEVEGLCTAHQAEVKILRDLHSVEIKHKDSFYEAKKVRVVLELQTLYNTKLLGLYEVH